MKLFKKVAKYSALFLVILFLSIGVGAAGGIGFISSNKKEDKIFPDTELLNVIDENNNSEILDVFE